MESEPLKLKPHHAEGVMRHIKWGKDNHREMYTLLTTALETNPNAEVVFVRGVDNICKNCILGGHGTNQCANSAGIVAIDEAVAREHGWEFDKPYPLKDILEQLRAEAPVRANDGSDFLFCLPTREEYERWLADIRKNKR